MASNPANDPSTYSRHTEVGFALVNTDENDRLTIIPRKGEVYGETKLMHHYIINDKDKGIELDNIFDVGDGIHIIIHYKTKGKRDKA